jgi:t-SNARE complex subunit (syntaxin)
MNATRKKRIAALLMGIIIVVFMVIKILRDGILQMYAG